MGTADSNRTQASCAPAALLSSRTAMPDACMKHSIYFVRRGESNPAANNPCPVCLSTPSVRLSRLPDCHVSGLWGAGSRTPDNLCRATFAPLSPPLRRRHPESILRYLVSSAICSLSAASTNFGQFMTIISFLPSPFGRLGITHCLLVVPAAVLTVGIRPFYEFLAGAIKAAYFPHPIGKGVGEVSAG